MKILDRQKSKLNHTSFTAKIAPRPSERLSQILCPGSVTNFTNSPIQKSIAVNCSGDGRGGTPPAKENAKPTNYFGDCQVECSRKIPLPAAPRTIAAFVCFTVSPSGA